MSLVSFIDGRRAALQAFGALLDEESTRWKDRKFRELRTGHLDALVACNARFDATLDQVNRELLAALRRLDTR